VATDPLQIVGELTVTVGIEFTTKVPEPVPVQPLVLVTHTVYVPATVVLKLCVPGSTNPFFNVKKNNSTLFSKKKPDFSGFFNF
jgi:hypothetical protein